MSLTLEVVFYMLRDRRELEENLVSVMESFKLKSKKKIIKEIKEYLVKEYDISTGDIQRWINDPQNLEEVDLRELYLFTEQVYAKSGSIQIKPSDYFTDIEIKEAKQFSGILEKKEKEMSFPITIGNATVVGMNAYMVTLDIKTIDKLLENNLLTYNFEVQREATFRKRKDKVVITPTLNQNSVKEISQHLIDSTLVPTVLVFNASVRSGKDGIELLYDSNKFELTINENVNLQIIDGYHRCRASQNALQRNPELEFNFPVLITNYSTRKSQQYQAQLAKSNKISKARIQELEANRLSDVVIQQLKDESDLKGRISQTSRIHSLNNELVTYSLLSDSIDEQFKMENRADAADVGDFLTEFVNMLLGSYPDEFMNKIDETRKVSLINDNNIFGIGYIVLARRMFEEKIKPKEIRKIIKEIDFSRDNKMWTELGILDEKGNLNETNKVRKVIKDYFENLEIGIKS